MLQRPLCAGFRLQGRVGAPKVAPARGRILAADEMEYVGPVNKAKSDVELATAYGRNCRKVFDGETWEGALERIKVVWETIPVDLPWDVAVPRIRAGWEQGPPDPID